MTEFEIVYQEYFKDVFLYVKGLSGNESIAEEITDETFFKAMKALDNFKGNCDIRVWLCQIAKNSYFSYIRKNSRVTGLENIEICSEQFDFIEKISNKEEALKIHNILHKMDEPYKEVFTLRVFGELSFSQIAGVFGKSDNWACVTYHRAKKKIQIKMEGFHNG